jgi:hypothetical protein
MERPNYKQIAAMLRDLVAANGKPAPGILHQAALLEAQEAKQEGGEGPPVDAAFMRKIIALAIEHGDTHGWAVARNTLETWRDGATLNAPTPPSAEAGAVDMREVMLLLETYESWISAIPKGAEHPARGCSTFNWHAASIRMLREWAETQATRNGPLYTHAAPAGDAEDAQYRLGYAHGKSDYHRDAKNADDEQRMDWLESKYVEIHMTDGKRNVCGPNSGLRQMIDALPERRGGDK